MNKKEYANYEKRIGEFYERENLFMLNNGAINCFCGAHIDFNVDPWECSDCQASYEIINEPSFSWKPCECCGSALGGDRYIATGILNDDPILGKNVMFEYSICVDCMYYIEYGRLDDMTMMEIEEDNS